VRKIVNITHMSLDGVIERMEDWHFQFFDADLDRSYADLLATADALLMGRRTYEGFALAWPNDTGVIADQLNAMKKYVASTTLTAPEWNNTTVIRGDLVEAVTELKSQPGKSIMMYGFGPVAEALVRADLLDELHVGVNPMLAGVGEPGEMLLRQGFSARFELLGTEVLSSGIVLLSYRPARSS
jgi:dihydrofolate reductase